MKKGSLTSKLRITFFLYRKPELLWHWLQPLHSEFHIYYLLPGEGITGLRGPCLRQWLQGLY
jgi:hypothetical protein